MKNVISIDAPFLDAFREQKRQLLIPRPPKYGRYAVLKNQIIVLEGMPGVGKSTLGPAMAAMLNEAGVAATYLPERIDDDELAKYLADREHRAAAFQMSALDNRMEVHGDAVCLAASGHAVVVDRGLVGDAAFAIMQRALHFFTDDEWEAYCFKLECARLHQASVLVHLSCTPEMSIRRVACRDNKAESVYDPTYMANYGAALEVSKALFHAGPGIVLEWNEDPEGVVYNDDGIEDAHGSLTASGNRVRLTDAKVAGVLDAAANSYCAFYRVQVHGGLSG